MGQKLSSNKFFINEETETETGKETPWGKAVSAFGSWKFQHVLEARTRLSLFFAKEKRLFITRKEFWEIFSDYSPGSFKINNNRFVQLPLDIFMLFEEEDETCDSREVFCILSLLCQSGSASLGNRFNLLLPLFGDEIEKNRAVQLIGCTLRPLMKWKVVSNIITWKDITNVAEKIFTFSSVKICKTLSGQLISEFFLLNEEFSSFLSLFLSETEKAAAKMNSLGMTEEELKKSSSKIKLSVKMLLENRDLSGKKKSTQNNRKQNEIVNAQKLKKLQQESKKRERDAKRLAKAKLKALKEIDKLSSEDFRNLKAKFAQLNSSSKGIPRDRFIEVLGKEFSVFQGMNLLDNKFRHSAHWPVV
eukprot:snap_masked-scaffold_54-processed-gene-0.7-mRNA-1 protein AED:1.00 eAED:1.00 QI:0/-1/0/0/-1/1/1/0/360